MAGRSRSKAKPRPKQAGRGAAEALPQARVLPSRREVAPANRFYGRLAIGIGITLAAAATVVTAFSVDGRELSVGTFALVYGLGLIGVGGVVVGAAILDRRGDQPVRADVRRWIYGALAAVFALAYALMIAKVIPSRLPSAVLHLATIPAFTLVMAVGTLVGARYGWWMGVIGGSVILMSSIMLIARILVSAAFLAGVYGAFGKAASTFALVAVALLIEVVALLPICLVKFLMSRSGRRAYGV
jgi:MFS family permease